MIAQLENATTVVDWNMVGIVGGLSFVAGLLFAVALFGRDPK